ncbi:hypothetical protein [Psychromonas antarctica]|uniref:hypothetical protein n=1 Tax=Psychromonas antarctica TaxID=67573 RepID=UPI001EE81C4A|nr:hypothetical protein [Psychromonas antarctica]MCG6200846.1 hypothetical protein [Psychromonas antarctica]
MIFYLPIYKQTKEELEAFIDDKTQNEIEALAALENDGKVSDRLQTLVRSKIHTEYGRSWDQNRAVGWVSVSRGKNGFAFCIGKSNSLKSNSPKKYFELVPSGETHGSWQVIDFLSCNNPEKILSKFVDIFASIVAEGPFKACYIDDSSIRAVYKFVDWNGLIESYIE